MTYVKRNNNKHETTFKGWLAVLALAGAFLFCSNKFIGFFNTFYDYSAHATASKDVLQVDVSRVIQVYKPVTYVNKSSIPPDWTVYQTKCDSDGDCDFTHDEWVIVRRSTVTGRPGDIPVPPVIEYNDCEGVTELNCEMELPELEYVYRIQIAVKDDIFYCPIRRDQWFNSDYLNKPLLIGRPLIGHYQCQTLRIDQ